MTTRTPTPALFLLAMIVAFAWMSEPARGQAKAIRETAAVKKASKDDAPNAEKPAPAASDASKKVTPPTFFMRDGSKVTGKPTFRTIEVSTKYGRLSIPAAELVQVRFSRRISNDIGEKVDAFIEQLGSDDFDTREEAMDEIRALGADAEAKLRHALKSDDEEIRDRVEILIDELSDAETTKSEAEEAVVPTEVPTLSGDQDEIITKRFTILGRAEIETVTVESLYGPLSLPVSDIVGIFFKAGGSLSKTLNLQGSQTSPSNWLSTKLQLRKGQKLRVTATGTLNVPNYGLSSGPAGTTRSRVGGFLALAVVGKIGKKGKTFLIGADHKSKVPAAGTLYLAVVPFRSYPAVGSYKVKIKAQN